VRIVQFPWKQTLKQIKIDEIRIYSASSEKKDGDSEDCIEERNSRL
jgi:hypothetical protein